jgi:hypothetical protein
MKKQALSSTRRTTKVRHGLKYIDISNVPELLSIVEEVRNSQEPRVLRRDSEDVAVLMPVPSTPQHRAKRIKSKADYEAFRSAAGGWKDEDTDTLIKNIYEDRRMSNRPLAEL